VRSEPATALSGRSAFPVSEPKGNGGMLGEKASNTCREKRAAYYRGKGKSISAILTTRLLPEKKIVECIAPRNPTRKGGESTRREGGKRVTNVHREKDESSITSSEKRRMSVDCGAEAKKR